MGEIKESLKLVALFAHRREESMSLQLGYAGEAIEEELRAHDKEIVKFREEQSYSSGRIEALEEQVKHVLFGTTPFVKKIPTDKDGKPEGGLKPGDILLGHTGSIVRFGIFHHYEDGMIWGYWGSLDNTLKVKTDETLGYWNKRKVTFLFRPKSPAEGS